MMSDTTIRAVLDGRSPGAVIHAKAEAALPTIPDDSVDAIVTDPPDGAGGRVRYVKCKGCGCCAQAPVVVAKQQ